MAWPPTLPPNNRTNATDMVDAHASDHNKIADALSTLTSKGTLTNPFRLDANAITNPGTTGANVAYWWRIGQRVFMDFLLSISTGVVLPAGTNLRLTLPFPKSVTYPTSGNSPYAPRAGGVEIYIGTPTLGGYWGLWDMSVNVDPAFTGLDVKTLFSINSSHLIAGALIAGQMHYATDA